MTFSFDILVSPARNSMQWLGSSLDQVSNITLHYITLNNQV